MSPKSKKQKKTHLEEKPAPEKKDNKHPTHPQN